MGLLAQLQEQQQCWDRWVGAQGALSAPESVDLLARAYLHPFCEDHLGEQSSLAACIAGCFVINTINVMQPNCLP